MDLVNNLILFYIKAMRTLLCLFLAFLSVAEGKVVSSLEVSSDGEPSKTTILELDRKYQIKVSGALNLGKYWQGSTVLANDACYEFVASTGKMTSPLKNFRNSFDINVCEGHYSEDHTYFSKPFVAKQNKIHFWIDDFDYTDNTGALHVEIIEVE